MKKSLRLITLLVISIALALNAWGQVGVNTLPDRLPIGDWDSIRLWTLTNTLWQTECSVQISYQDSVDTNKWTGNMAWRFPVDFASYGDYEAYLQEKGMYWIEKFKGEGYASPGSQIHLASKISIVWEDERYAPLILNADLGPIEGVTSNSFLGLYQKFPGVVIPVKGLEQFGLQYGDGNAWPPQFWYKWDHGTNSLSWGGKSDYCATTNTVILNSVHLLATNRIRFTAVANGWTNVYTQHGDQLRPARITRDGDMLNINTPKGSDIVIQKSVNLQDWTTVLTRKWSENTNDVSFKIDTQSPQGFYRVSVR